VKSSRLFVRVVDAALRRPVALVALLALLALSGGLLAVLELRPTAGTDTLVDRDSRTFQATERYKERFGGDAVLVLVRGDLSKLMLTADVGRLLGLEGCLSGNSPPGLTNLPGGPRGPCAQLAREKPVQVVYGPATFVNESVRRIQEEFGLRQRQSAERERRAMEAARRLAAAQGRSRAEQERLARQARDLVRAEFLRELYREALRTGIRSVPRLNDTSFVSQLIFTPGGRPSRRCGGAARIPKARFAYLFPSECAALVQVRLRPDLSEDERDRAIALVRAATRMRDPAPDRDFRLRNGGTYTVTGVPVVVSALTTTISHSIVVLLIAALLVMAATLALVFRSVPRLLPLGIALAACGLLFGGMALLGVSLTMASIAVLPILVGLGVDYAIQLHSRFDEAAAEGLEPGAAARQAAARGAPTIAAACGATAAGFLVLLLSPVPMVRGFGLLLVIGVLLAFACALTAGFAVLAATRRSPGSPGVPSSPVPAPLRRAGTRLAASARGAGELIAGAAAGARDLVAGAAGGRGARAGRAAGERTEAAWRWALREATQRPARVLAVALGVAVLGFAADTQTEVVSDIQRLVPGDLPALRDVQELQDTTGVSGQIDVMVEGADLTDPAVLRWMTAYQGGLLRRYRYDSKRGCSRAQLCPALSLPDLFRTTNLGNQQAVRNLLDSVPPYFSQAVITADRRTATMSFGIRLMPLDRQQAVIEEMRRRLDPPAGTTARLAGLPVLAAEANDSIAAQWRRLLTVLAGLLTVALVLLLIYRRPQRALIPLVPIALATGWSALVLFLTRVPLNPMSVTLGALVIAIATEFSVLLSERYRQERAAGHSPEEALARTYASTGRAVLASGLTAIAGFAVLMFSSIRMLREFGLVTVIDLGVSLVGVMVVLPAVLMLDERGELLELPARALRRLRAGVRLPRRLRRARAAGRAA